MGESCGEIPLTVEIRETGQEIAVYHVGEPHRRDATVPTRVGLIRRRDGNIRGNHVFVAVWGSRYPEFDLDGRIARTLQP